MKMTNPMNGDKNRCKEPIIAVCSQDRCGCFADNAYAGQEDTALCWWHKKEEREAKQRQPKRGGSHQRRMETEEL